MFHEAENPKFDSKMIKKPEPEEAQKRLERGPEAEAQKPRKGPEEARGSERGPEGQKRPEEVRRGLESKVVPRS